ncbi:putative mitochondrial hypothetical protein [Leptomonas pyrrhocoris]|uniref:Uncharacterized protein n=1 Tax=Leptomonas pyrrhocoris TaxID=157538 RepID=A0A0M9G282_LEPPY|nr:putative mitochondrial hypothetical protein [Leptomonas pyrrhocoris]KPA80920.1 putative mitochondrial hypothetical protein [Leptomonas pyrrhocoris]|eukprot:XP_015659359.1 putative mitochondrial hypothetical protein [Leptomonas pyrrhocoris]
MFSQSKQGSMFSLGGPMTAASNKKSAKPLSQAERYEQALVTANVFLEDSRARMTKSREAYAAVANSNYWFYGYFGGNMVATMAVCLALGNRWAFFRSYSGWIALAGGYFGGRGCLNVHSSILLRGVVQQLDHEVEEAVRMDEQTEHIVPDYLREAERLKALKYELVATSPEAVEARSRHTELTLDDRADALVDAFLKRKEALEKK